MLNTFMTLYKEIILSVLSYFVGIDLKELRKTFKKGKSLNTDTYRISENIDIVSQKLEESKDIIDNALLEMDRQKKLYEKMKKEAEISQQVSSMSKEQISAVNEILEKTLIKQDKKSFSKNLLLNCFFVF